MADERDDSDEDRFMNIKIIIFIISFVIFIMIFAVLLIFVKVQTRNGYNLYYNSLSARTVQCWVSNLYYVDERLDRLKYQVKLNDNSYVIITECRNNTWDISLDILASEVKLCEYRNAPNLANITNYTSLFNVRCKDHLDKQQKIELIFVIVVVSVIILLIIGIFTLLFKMSINR